MKTTLKKWLMIGLPILAMGTYVLVTRFSGKPSNTEKITNGKKERGALPAEVFVVQPSGLNSSIQAVGTLLPNEEVDLICEAAGKVTGIHFNEGTRVKKGQLLLKVDDADLQAQLRRATYQHALLSERLRRQRVLLDRDAVSREEFDQVQTDFNMNEADIALLRVKIDRTEIRAPFDGIVGFRQVSLGSYLQPNTVVTHLIDDYKLKLEFAVPEKYVSRSLLSRTVNFKTEGTTGEHSATVYAIDPKVDLKTRTVAVRALYSNADRKLSSGMFARLNLITHTADNAIMIPTQAIVPVMDGKTVWVLTGGKAKSRKIETGQRREDFIEVTSGLSPGDSILTTGLMQVRENSTVNPLKK